MNISRQNAVSASWMTPAVLALACSLLGALIFEFSQKQNDGAADTTKTKSTKSDGEKAGEIPAAEARVEGKVTANSSAVTPMEKQATESRRRVERVFLEADEQGLLDRSVVLESKVLYGNLFAQLGIGGTVLDQVIRAIREGNEQHLQESLGANAYAQFLAKAPAAVVVSQIQNRLAVNGQQLTWPQAKQLAVILEQHSISKSSAGTGAIIGLAASVTDEVMQQAQGFLTESQIAVLREQQGLQQAQRALDEVKARVNRGG